MKEVWLCVKILLQRRTCSSPPCTPSAVYKLSSSKYLEAVMLFWFLDPILSSLSWTYLESLFGQSTSLEFKLFSTVFSRTVWCELLNQYIMGKSCRFNDVLMSHVMEVKCKVKNVLCKIWCPLWNTISGEQMNDKDLKKTQTTKWKQTKNTSNPPQTKTRQL